MSSLNTAAATTPAAKAGRPFSYLNEEAIRAAVLNHKPYDYAFVSDAIEERFKDEVLLDAPVIPQRGSYGLPSLRRGPKFEAVIQDLLSVRFRRIIEQKFDIDLSKN